MTFKKKFAAIAGAGLLITGLVAAQVAATHGDHMQFVATYLNLNDAQKQTVQAVLQDAKAQAEPIAAQLKTGHEEMSAAIKAGKSDAELTQIATAQGNLMGQLGAIHAKAMSKVYAQLTPDQKVKAEQLIEHFQGAMQQHFPGFMHHPAPKS